MTKDEMLKLLKESNEVKKAEDTIKNIDAKEVHEVKAAEGMGAEPLPTQKEVEKEVNAAEGPMIAVDKEGVSKDGGECDKLMSQDGVEAEKKKQDNGMKDVINVSSRKVEESAEVTNELLAQLKEAAAREEGYKAKIAEITSLCEKALELQKQTLIKDHAAEMSKVFEAVIAEGEMYKKAQKLYEGSSKLNRILLEAVKKAQPERKMTRYMTPAYRAIASMDK